MNIHILERTRKIITSFCQAECQGWRDKAKSLNLVKGKVKGPMFVSRDLQRIGSADSLIIGSSGQGLSIELKYLISHIMQSKTP